MQNNKFEMKTECHALMFAKRSRTASAMKQT